MSVLFFLFCLASLSVFIPAVEYASSFRRTGIVIGFGGLCLMLTGLLIEPLIIESLGV